MLWQGKICVPRGLVTSVVEEWHQFLCHTGKDKLVKELSRRFTWPSHVDLKLVVKGVRQTCTVCQACDYPNFSLRTPISMTPVPAHVMSSVALDFLALPKVEWLGESYDTLLVCVDRLTGWILARPTRKLNLTAERAAHLILDQGWDLLASHS